MENSLAEPQNSSYQTEARRKDNSSKSLPKKIGEKNRTDDKELTHKSIWRSINIFSKIKNISKGKSSESNAYVGGKNSKTVNSDNFQNSKTCKNSNMDDKLNLEENAASGSADEESASTESKSSFFGKMNLEGLLKIFVDLHKKKQLSQSHKSSKQMNDNESVAETNCAEKVQSSGNQNINTDIPEILQMCRSSSHVTCNDTIDFPLPQSVSLLNPVNTPSFINGTCDIEDSSNISESTNSTSQTDSTLNLLKCVRVKLNDYLNGENTEINDGDVNKVDSVIGQEVDMENEIQAKQVKIEDEHVMDINSINIMHSKTNVAEVMTDNTDSNEDRIISDNCSYNLSSKTDSTIDVKCEELGVTFKDVGNHEDTPIHNTESNDKKLAYAIVECDIKCMIKELLKESKDLKNSIVATGIEEEPIPQFNQISKYLDSVPLCESLFNDLINMATNKHAHSLKSKKHLNVTFKQDIEEDVSVLLGNLVENVLNTEPAVHTKNVCINFCLVQNIPVEKIRKLCKDPKTVKFRESSVYCLTKKFRKMQTTTRKIIYTPKVTVNNLSTSKYIKFMAVDNSLINRIRRSAALLMALYDEMRDYTYYSCTSNILCELYESMMRQGLISVANDTPSKSIETEPVAVNTAAAEKNETSRSSHRQVLQTSKSYISKQVKLFSPSKVPCCSSNSKHSSDSIDVRISSSNDSVSSGSDAEEIKPKLVLPNLKYTYQSDEEINTPEEVKMIDDNASRNGECGECSETHDTELDPASDDSMSMEYINVSINEDEAFLKE